MRLLRGAALIVRPLNCALFFVGTFVGGILAVGSAAFLWPGNLSLLLSSLAATAVGASGNVINDVYDVEIDRVNRPRRPLPLGLLSTRQALSLWATLAIGGMALAALVSVQHALIAAGSVALLVAYSARAKSIAVVGNAVVSTVVAVALLFGAMSVGSGVPAVPAAIFAFLTTFGREVIKDIEDWAGDSAHLARSTAVRYGAVAASRLAAFTLMVTVGLTPVPYLWLDYTATYLLVMLVASGFLVAAAESALRTEFTSFATRASALTKSAMVAGLFALAVA